MNKLLIAAALVAGLPWSAGAQVAKQVEVSKAYVPNVAEAAKLPVEPDMTDTVRMRPEIDYRIEPLSLRTTLATRPIRPATVTYWEFNRPTPCYLKLGAGYPLNSVADLYVSTQNPSTGYVVGYLNHEGRYADLRNDFGVRRNALRMSNAAGAAAGKYFGRHILEGDIRYDNRLYHRYAFSGDAARVDYGDARAAVRFGDDFEDLRRVNFEVGLGGGIFFDHSDYSARPSLRRGGETHLEAHARVGKGFGSSSLTAGAGYERGAGRETDGYERQTVRAQLRYGYRGGVVSLEAGGDFYHDVIRMPRAAEPASRRSRGDYFIPYLHLNFNLGSDALHPFLEMDGGVTPADLRTLAGENPYLFVPVRLDRSEARYEGRFGIGGGIRGRFTYRLHAAIGVRDNHPYWYTTEPDAALPGAMPGDFFVARGRQTAFSLEGRADYRPLDGLLLSFGASGFLYNDEGELENGSPAFEGHFRLRYEGRKVSFHAGVEMQSRRQWSMLRSGAADDPQLLEHPYARLRVPFAADLRAGVDWRVSPRTVIFAEGDNLLNRRLCRWPLYPEYGACCTVGVKLVF